MKNSELDETEKYTHAHIIQCTNTFETTKGYYLDIVYLIFDTKKQQNNTRETERQTTKNNYLFRFSVLLSVCAFFIIFCFIVLCQFVRKFGVGVFVFNSYMFTFVVNCYEQTVNVNDTLF